MRIYNRKIEVKGEIQIGKLLNLVQGRDLSQRIEPRFDASRPTQGINPVHFYRSIKQDSSGQSEEKIRFYFEDTKKDLYIEDQGLCQSYGIFGLSGTGKTNLLEHLIQQILAHKKGDRECKFGGLIIDPKAALIDPITEIMRQIGRQDDLLILHPRDGQAVNIIDAAFDPYDLGKALFLAAKNSGIGASDPYWLQNLEKITGAAIHVLDTISNSVPTLKDIVDVLTTIDEIEIPEARHIDTVPRLRIHLNDAKQRLKQMTEDEGNDLKKSIQALEEYLKDEKKYVQDNFTRQAFGEFQWSKYKCFSPSVKKSERGMSIYDQIIENGKVVLLSIASTNLAIAKILCTLIKCLFQNAVLTRLDRFDAKKLKNFDRPLLFVADEYSTVATDLPGEAMGDSHFFSQARQFGCMALIATQNIHQLENSSLGKNWKSVFSNFASKIFMRVGDAETAEEASKLVGDGLYNITYISKTFGKEGIGIGEREERRERKDLPSNILTQMLKIGECVVIGSLDGNKTTNVYFVRVPERK